MQDRKKDKQFSAGRHGDAFWQEEQSNFGVKLMSKMGWEQGKGLGKDASGTTSFIRAKKKEDNKGIGCTMADGNDNYSAAQGVFNDLLKRLSEQHTTDTANGESGNGHVKTDAEEAASTPSGDALKNFIAKRTLYGKFRRSKDAASYSANHMAEIMGKKKEDITPSKNESTERKESVQLDSSIITKTSTVNLKDYFASKLASKKTTAASSSSEDEEEARPTLGLGASSRNSSAAEEAEVNLQATFGNKSKLFGSLLSSAAHKPVSQFQAASGHGFTENQQTDYYNTMLGMAIGGAPGQKKSRGGLGFGHAGGVSEEQREANTKPKNSRKFFDEEPAPSPSPLSSPSPVSSPAPEYEYKESEEERAARKASKKAAKKAEKKRKREEEAAEQAATEEPAELSKEERKRLKKEKKAAEAAAAQAAAEAEAAAAESDEKSEKKKKKKKLKE